jgi:hypothetical protein
MRLSAMRVVTGVLLALLACGGPVAAGRETAADGAAKAHKQPTQGRTGACSELVRANVTATASVRRAGMHTARQQHVMGLGNSDTTTMLSHTCAAPCVPAQPSRLRPGAACCHTVSSLGAAGWERQVVVHAAACRRAAAQMINHMGCGSVS